MSNSAILLDLIKRYNLNGEIESVKLVSDGSKLSVRFISSDTSMLGKVTADISDVDFDVDAGEYCIYTTSKLKSMIDVMSYRIKVKHIDNTLHISDGKVAAMYMLAKPDVIPLLPEKANLDQPFGATVNMTGEFISGFIKASAVLSNEETFVFYHDDSGGWIEIGYDGSRRGSSQKKHKISFEVTNETVCDNGMSPIEFNSKMFKNILLANRDMSNAQLKISSEGLAKVTFEDDFKTSEYYLVAKNG